MQEIVKGGLYRHFKGMYYYVLDVATHSETGEKFVSDVDRKKYPDVAQKERFKLMSGRD